ncbi:hypothetical protein DXG03_002488 [Asterophora parasitica]|uniref:Fungal-type protein kinase domain-containing protein n=1 Tax=Asterophora parasitica TaxID=117018 RepID=A0A9P7G5Q3_9AGAR|nr:hypothetical protein DXG03_002488 [Asterophora parasitica]
MFDRVGIVHSDFFSVNDQKDDFLRIIVGLMFCEDDYIGYDPTIIPSAGHTFRIQVGEHNYRTLELLHQIEVVVKDVWADTSFPYPEDYFLDKAKEHGIRDILEVTQAVDVQGQSDDTNRHVRDQLGARPENCAHRRYVTRSCGIPITEFRDKNELMQVAAFYSANTAAYGIFPVYERLVQAGLLHRDISGNSMSILRRFEGLMSLLPPYFSDLAPCHRELRKAIFLNDDPLTHATMIGILKKCTDATLTEDFPPVKSRSGSQTF